MLIGHAAGPQLLLGRPIFGPNGLRLADHVIGALRDHGFTDKLAGYGYIVFLNYVVGLRQPGDRVRQGPDGRERLDQVESFLGGPPKDQYPDLTAGRFTLGLGAILDRLETEKPRSTAKQVVRGPVRNSRRETRPAPLDGAGVGGIASDQALRSTTGGRTRPAAQRKSAAWSDAHWAKVCAD